MTRRTRARVVVTQLLYQLDISPKVSPGRINEYFQTQIKYPELIVFAKDLYHGVRTNLESIDSMIREVLSNWNLNRLSLVDRNIIRIGVFELTHFKQDPPAVIINEAVEIAKYFASTRLSSAFVNGILDAIYHHRPFTAPTQLPAALTEDELRKIAFEQERLVDRDTEGDEGDSELTLPLKNKIPGITKDHTSSKEDPTESPQDSTKSQKGKRTHRLYQRLLNEKHVAKGKEKLSTANSKSAQDKLGTEEGTIDQKVVNQGVLIKEKSFPETEIVSHLESSSTITQE